MKNKLKLFLGALVFLIGVAMPQSINAQEPEMPSSVEGMEKEIAYDLIEMLYDTWAKDQGGGTYLFSQMAKDAMQTVEEKRETHSLNDAGSALADSFAVEGYIWDQTLEFGTDVFEENILTSKEIDMADGIDVLYALGEFCAAARSDEVDSGVMTYVESLRLASTLIDTFADDKTGLILSGAQYIAEGSADFVEFVVTSKEYEEWKADIDTPEEFSEKFWDTAIEGVVVGMLRFPADLVGLTMDLAGVEIEGFRWSSLGDEVERIYYEGLIPKDLKRQTVYSTSGTHLVIEWGTDIEDFNVMFVDP